MNSYLLDTHSFLWSIWQPEKLGQQAVAVLENTDNKQNTANQGQNSGLA